LTDIRRWKTHQPKGVFTVRKGFLLRSVVAAAVIAATVGSGLPASAEAVASAPSPTKVVISQGMTFAGIDEKVARKNGFEVVYNEAGKAVAVKRPGEDVSTAGYGQAEGNCGISYIYFDGIGGQRARITTGFFLYNGREAIEYYWEVGISDSRGNSVQRWGPAPLNFQDSWEDTRDVGNLGKGHALAGVFAISHAILWTGAICVSGSPTAATIIW
jgi:hypothetical protein